MAYHFDLNTWGHLGVTIFFVLSGFLITSILLEQRHQKLGHYLAVFYQRRTLRIFPLYYAYVLALGVAFWAWGRPLGFDTNWPYLVTYTTNFAPLDPDWFSSAFYGHLWSLGVEEQFYLLWPFLIYFLSPKGSKALMIALVVACPAIRMLMYSLLMDVAPSVDALGSAQAVRAEEVLDGLPVSCWDAFAAGALINIAGLRARSRRFWGWYVAVLSVATVGFGAYLLAIDGVGSGFLPWRLVHAVLHERLVGYTIRNFWIVAFLVAALEWAALRALLSASPMAFIGKISYGMYVFHWPIMVPFRRLFAYEPLSLKGALMFILYSAIVTAVSYASYRWFESWFLQRKRPYAKHS